MINWTIGNDLNCAIILYASLFDFGISFDFIQIIIVLPLSSISMIFCIIPYCILRIQTNCRIAISGNRSTKMCLWGWQTRCAKKREKGWRARESDVVVGRTKENGICTGSQPNPTSSKCRKDGSRIKATRSECHPLRNRPCKIRLGWRGNPTTVLIFFVVAIRKETRQMRDKCGSHRSSSRNARHPDRHNSGSAILSLVPINLTWRTIVDN